MSVLFGLNTGKCIYCRIADTSRWSEVGNEAEVFFSHTFLMRLIRTSISALCLMVALFILAPVAMAESPASGNEPLEIEFDEGVKYEKIPGAKSTFRNGKIEVVEYFWYGCPHCYEFLPLLLEWEKKLPDDVRFTPAALGGSERWTLDAKVYYAGLALKLPADFHRNFFLARHSAKTRHRLLEPEDIADFFVKKYGKTAKFDRSDYLKVLNSFSVAGQVNSKLNRAKSWGVNSVPELVVDGRFLIRRQMAGSYPAMLKVVESLFQLIRRENAAKAAAKAAASGKRKTTDTGHEKKSEKQD